MVCQVSFKPTSPPLQLPQAIRAVAFSIYWRSQLPFAGFKTCKPIPSAPMSHSGQSILSYWRSKLLCLPKFKTRKQSPAAPTSHSGRGILFYFILVSKVAACEASKPANLPLQLPRATRALTFSFYGRSRLPFVMPQNTQAIPCSSDEPLGSWHSLLTGVQGWRLPGFKMRKPSPAAPMSH